MTKDQQIQVLEQRVAEYMQIMQRTKALIDESRYELGWPRKGKFPTWHINMRERALTLLQQASDGCRIVGVFNTKSIAEEFLGKDEKDGGDYE